ncbi:MAG: hypothetical protein KDA45_09335 [Planctomycetales bacterium]|nr:hypothetical protein [Planctomycetales bacterium]
MTCFLRVAAVAWLSWSLGASAVLGQQASGTATEATNTQQPPSWVVRDPYSGRWYRQQIVPVTVPTVQWESKPQTTTVYEPKTVVKNLPTQQTVYTPSTQYVLQPRLRGWWNPLRQPVAAYEFVPVTSWRPQTQTVQNQVATVEWVAKQQVVHVPQPVQRLQTQQQLVQTEIAPPATGYSPASGSMLAAQPRPLLTIPLLAQQRLLPWPSASSTPAARSMVGSGLRPIAAANASGSGYTAPLQTASTASGPLLRDPTQTGMAATVLR